MMENLDLKCAELGKRLAETGADEKTFNDVLSVLEEQGVYAAFLYLDARGKEDGRKIRDNCAEFLRKTPSGSPLLANGDLWRALQTLAEDLDNLLLTRDLLRQALVYGRYHLKASSARNR